MSWLDRYFVSRYQFARTIEELNERIDRMASQADIDAITQQVNQVATDLGTTRTTLQQEIDQLSQANPSVDVSALQAAVEPLDQAVNDLAGLKPDAPSA